jgi:S-adenosylmethionine hydrolase
LRWAAVPAEGSQFRSRDLFPQAAAAIALGRPEALAEVIDPADIPTVPASCIAYIDGYGNLKTTIRSDASAAPSGSRVRVRIGVTEREAMTSDGNFEVGQGELAFAPGSSGWTDAAGAETRWMELFLRGGNAWETFGRPHVGDAIEIIA